MLELSTVNRLVAGSSPTAGVMIFRWLIALFLFDFTDYLLYYFRLQYCCKRSFTKEEAMEGKFTVSEVVSLLYLRAPPRVIPQFRLQNFLLRKKDWKTNHHFNMHISEQGELDTLRWLLGKERLERINAVEKKFLRRKEKASGCHITSLFPTPKDFLEFIEDVKKILGKSITLRL